MRYNDFYDYEPDPQHPEKRERPRDIAPLYVHTAEWADFRRICQAHGATEIIGVRKVPIIPAHTIEVLCEDAATALALMAAWGEFCEISPHRPHTREEAIAWGEQHAAKLDIPRDWTL